jgi:hypothetical protein
VAPCRIPQKTQRSKHVQSFPTSIPTLMGTHFVETPSHLTGSSTGPEVFWPFAAASPGRGRAEPHIARPASLFVRIIVAALRSPERARVGLG